MPMPPAMPSPQHFVMDRWLDILKNEPPRMVDTPILYHYTDAFGASGIISSNTLWATATQFSNDLSEIEYASTIAKGVIREIWEGKGELSAWEHIFVEHLVRLFETPLHSFGQSFIVSFCEEGDLLSQWRGYGQASGFSLAFKSLCKNDELRLESQHGFRTMVKRVIYEPGKQRSRLRYLLRRFIKLVNEFPFRPHSSLGYRPPAPAAWLTNNMGCGEVETATRFPLLHTPDGGYLNSEIAALH